MQSESCFCGYCQKNNKSHTGLDVPNDQWLEELGDMIEATVEGLRKGQSFTSCRYGSLVTS